jgi:hypothetical protein
VDPATGPIQRLTELPIMRLAASVPAYLAFAGMQLAPRPPELSRRHDDILRQCEPVAPLCPVEAAVVAGIERHGVFTTSLSALRLEVVRGDDILKSGRQAAMLLEDRTAFDRRSGMIVSKAADLMRHAPLYQWGLAPALLRIAESYLCMPAAFDGPLIFRTLADGREVGTRKWHLDREDRRVIKVALYLHDVDENGGPFQILKQEADRGDGSFTYPTLTTAELQRKLVMPLNQGDITTCTGKAGTLVFADTARFFHRGLPATGRERFAIFYSYFARRPRHPFFCKGTRLSRRQILQLVEGFTAEQQATALWRDNLSWGARLIPPSLI